MTWHVATFTEVELYGLWALAQNRNAKRPGVQSRKMYDGANDLVTNYVGLKAEYAFARLAGVSINTQVNAGGGGSTAFVLHGRTVLVRASDDLLIFNTADDFVTDTAVLVSPYGTERDPFVSAHPRHWKRDVVVKGYVHRADFLRHAFTRDLGYGSRLCLRDGQLHPVRELLEPQPAPVQLALAV